MKKRIVVILFVVLLAAMAITTLWNMDYGYVLITNGSLQADWTLTQALVLVVVAFTIFYFIIFLFNKIWRFPQLFQNFRHRQRAERARRNIIQGLIELTEGHWRKAEQILLRDIEESETPLLNYLLAARAAQQQDADERRDEHLKRAHKTTPQADIAIGLTQAELQLAHGQTEQALATLTRLRELAPRHPYVLKLLSRLYAQVNEWSKLAALLPEIRKHRIITGDKLLQLERKAYTQFIHSAARSRTIYSLEEQWKQVPKHYRNDPEIFQVYINCLLDNDQIAIAEKELRTYLGKHWEEMLVQLYGTIALPQPVSRYLDYAEAWLKDHGRSPMLLLTLGRLCSRLRLWGKARVYYESSVAIHPTVEAYAELGELLESLGELDSARECFQKGLALSKGVSRSRRLDDRTETKPLPPSASNDEGFFSEEPPAGPDKKVAALK
jgi:HemY protein